LAKKREKKIQGGQNGKNKNPGGDVTLNQHLFCFGLTWNVPAVTAAAG